MTAFEAARLVELLSFTRSVRLSAGVPEEDVTAAWDQGVLTVRAPIGTAEKASRTIEITRGA
ncbi:Hsp20 family protein [Kitasatospora sp. NPDC094016]|uniref:Hsp20 family protein n=1 Tax=Kitasatospora sp. NPDC094016 TaxID=3154986 RepID=UPI0033322A3A